MALGAPVGGGLIPKQTPLGGLAMPLTQGMVSNGTGKNPFVSTDVTPVSDHKKAKKRDDLKQGSRKAPKKPNVLLPEAEKELNV